MNARRGVIRGRDIRFKDLLEFEAELHDLVVTVGKELLTVSHLVLELLCESRVSHIGSD